LYREELWVPCFWQGGKRLFSNRNCWSAVFIALITITATGVGLAEESTGPVVRPRIEMKGAYIRVAYNAEAWVVLGFQPANFFVGEDWMLLDVGITLLPGEENQNLAREDIKLLTPKGSVIAMATQEDYGAAAGVLKMLNKRANLQGESINYFPVGTTEPCRIGFFSNPTEESPMPYEKVELANGRACLGRLFFNIPGGTEYGQYWLLVQFDKGQLKVPFKVMTDKEARTNYKAYRKMEKEQKKAKKSN
jgi:hypothetical protein